MARRHAAAKIAAEKAGIIKPARARPQGRRLAGSARPSSSKSRRGRTTRSLRIVTERRHATSAAGSGSSFRCLGEHQRRNAALALAAVETLQPVIPVSSEAVARGLKRSSLARPVATHPHAGRAAKSSLMARTIPTGVTALRAALAKAFPGPQARAPARRARGQGLVRPSFADARAAGGLHLHRAGEQPAYARARRVSRRVSCRPSTRGRKSSPRHNRRPKAGTRSRRSRTVPGRHRIAVSWWARSWSGWTRAPPPRNERLNDFTARTG